MVTSTDRLISLLNPVLPIFVLNPAVALVGSPIIAPAELVRTNVLDGQTNIPISLSGSGLPFVMVNGMHQIEGRDFMLSGSSILWLSPDFQLSNEDVVQIGRAT